MSRLTAPLVIVLQACGPTVAPPPECPEPAPVAPPSDRDGPVPALLKGDYELAFLQPKDHPAAPPETYLLPPEERSKCAFVRIVFTFEGETLGIRYEALCVEPEDRSKRPIPLKWCSTHGTMHIRWDVEAFELPVHGGTEANVQQIASYAPGTGPTGATAERTVWGCKFNLDAQRFVIASRDEEGIRLRTPKYETEWILKPTDRPAMDPDDVVRVVEPLIHPPNAGPAPAPPTDDGL